MRNMARSESEEVVVFVIQVLQLGMSSKSTTSVRLSPTLEEALDAYRSSLRVPPSKSAVIMQALTDFLEKEGFGNLNPADKEQASKLLQS